MKFKGNLIERLAKNLRRIRERNQVSQSVLAGRSGVSRQRIIDLEAGTSSDTKISTLGKIADALQVQIKDLLR